MFTPKGSRQKCFRSVLECGVVGPTASSQPSLQPSPTSRIWRVLRVLLALLLLGAFAVFIALVSARYVEVGEVQVPGVVGEDVREASRTLQGLGFEVSTYADRAAALNRVGTQTPAEGAVVRRGRGVVLSVGENGERKLPNLTGLTQAQATEALAAAQLSPAVSYRYAPQPAGVVLAQRPGAGAVAGAGVALTLSLGPRPPRVALPRLVGTRVDVAEQRLTTLGFRRIERVPTRLGAPGVNAQTPAAGVRTALSEPVTLFYTVGNRQVVPVPSVVGLGVQAAARRLQAAGLRVGWVSEDAFDPAQPQGVLEVTPPDYTLWGTPVTLRTNGNAGSYRALEPTPPPALPPQASSASQLARRNGSVPRDRTQTPSALPDGGFEIPIFLDPAYYSFLRGRPYTYRVEVSDDEGDRVVLDRSAAADETIEDTVTVYGAAEVRTYIDGDIISAYNATQP